MTVVFLTKEKQQVTLEEYNANKRLMDKIPLLPRNLNSGWPLLQVSLFAARGDDTFGFVLGGGKCHDVSFEVFFFAEMLKKLPGKIFTNLKENWLDGGPLPQLKFNFHHQRYGIIIETVEQGMGYSRFNIRIPDNDADKFLGALLEARRIAYSKPTFFESNFGFGEYHADGTIFTKNQIEEALNRVLAVFHEGQVYVDFGAMLRKAGIDGDIYNYFKLIFKVDEFNRLKELIRLEAPVIQEAPVVQEVQKPQEP